MPQLIPPPLAPYLQVCLHTNSLTLVTSTLSTPASWLLVRFLQAVFHAGDNDGQIPRPSSAQGTDAPSVIFVSLVRPQDLWTELSKKVGIDLPGLLKKNRISYVDGLKSQQDINSSTTNHIGINSLTLESVLSAIKHAVSSQPTPPSPYPSPSSHPPKPTILIDGLDLILAAQPDPSTVTIQTFIATTRSLANALVLTTSADSPLLHNRHDSATPLERNHAAFVASMAHQSAWVMQLRALDTGSARDVTGVLRVCRGSGGGYEGLGPGPGLGERAGATTGLEDAEWLYQLKNDGGVRVWQRGGF